MASAAASAAFMLLSTAAATAIINWNAQFSTPGEKQAKAFFDHISGPEFERMGLAGDALWAAFDNEASNMLQKSKHPVQGPLELKSALMGGEPIAVGQRESNGAEGDGKLSPLAISLELAIEKRALELFKNGRDGDSKEKEAVQKMKDRAASLDARRELIKMDKSRPFDPIADLPKLQEETRLLSAASSIQMRAFEAESKIFKREESLHEERRRLARSSAELLMRTIDSGRFEANERPRWLASESLKCSIQRGILCPRIQLADRLAFSLLGCGAVLLSALAAFVCLGLARMAKAAPMAAKEAMDDLTARHLAQWEAKEIEGIAREPRDTGRPKKSL